jgi:hypothetical protein
MTFFSMYFHWFILACAERFLLEVILGRILHVSHIPFTLYVLHIAITFPVHRLNHYSYKDVGLKYILK